MTVADFYGVNAETIVQQVDTITLSHTSPASLSRKGIVSYPASETAGASPTADVIAVYDTTTSTALVLGTDYTLTASGDGETRTYTVTRINSSSSSSDGDTATVTYKWGTIPGTLGQMGYAGTSPTGTAFEASDTDTTGTGASGLGAALPGGSLTDPAAGAQSSSETGAPGSEYAVTEQAPGTYGWASGAPDTEGVYGGDLPESFDPVNTSYGGTGASTQWDTTIGGGGVLIPGLGTPPVYRAPTSGVAAGAKDTTLTDILGNEASAPTVPSTTAYAATNVDTSYFGAPAAPTALKTQTDTVATATASGSPRYYLSQQGLVPSSIVVSDTTTPATMVLGTDYAVTTAGNGPTTVAYIVLTSGTNFTNGDNISIVYSYGDATYWDSNVPSAVPTAPGTPSVTAKNRGVLASWTPPSGTTPVDYYLLQSDDLGTQYVPATGQPVLSGQPSPSGGASVGQPTYQADTVGFVLTTPTGLALSTHGTAGTTHYSYRVSAVGVSGETLACAEVTITTGAASLTSSNYVILTWNAVTGAAGYNVYGRTASGELKMTPTPITALTFNDTGAATPSGALPSANTTGVFSQSGILTPYGQVVVRDTTRVGSDPLQADGQVLEYGYDYTIAVTGIGPWATYAISLVASSVNAQAGDSLTVEYWYGADPSTVKSLFTQGIVENTAIIYKPSGSTYSQHGYRFSVAAGNRAGLGPFSAWSSYVVPLNYNAPQPGHEGATETITSLDAANTVNPIYNPDGTVKAGTGLGG